MSRHQHQASVSHDKAIIEELRASREFAVAYLQAALEELEDADNRAAGLLALRDIAEAYGGMAAIAQEAGITREALYRALSPHRKPYAKNAHRGPARHGNAPVDHRRPQPLFLSHPRL